ncbi:MAG: MTAP family purine nucleoside phosphorylase [Nitrospinae bacterium]|nr:MTAP family purine nucleoside phosphorylase [Nitrospinota bacterium]
MTTLAVIGGSGAYDLIGNGLLSAPVPVAPVATPFGAHSPVFKIRVNGMEFCFMSRHGEGGYNVAAPFVNYRANIWALKELGVERIISWSGPGIINPSFEVGAFAVPHDVIDQTKSRPSTFFTGGGAGFIRMSDPFCPDLRHALLYSLQLSGAKNYHEAVYICTEGPRLETAAEIRLFHSYGADLVGMTLVPELFLARELEMCYASVCYLTNYAEGICRRDYVKGELFEGMQTPEEKQTVQTAMRALPAMAISALTAAAGMPRECGCKDAMLRYKKRGDLPENWREWIKS